MSTTQPEQRVTGLVLAGGMGRRMDSRDKGLVLFRGQPMVAHVVSRLAPQVGPLIINANRNTADYAAMGYPVIGDQVGGFAGPLAGLQAGMAACTTELVVTAPCDSPFLPLDLVARLLAALENEIAELAVARSGGFAQPVFALYSVSLLPSLTAFLESGGRKIDTWYAQHCMCEVEFGDESAFANINTLDELQQLQ
jgi:molybdopterin-guanine dinucleotide biosynthesis protein A